MQFLFNVPVFYDIFVTHLKKQLQLRYYSMPYHSDSCDLHVKHFDVHSYN